MVALDADAKPHDGLERAGVELRLWLRLLTCTTTVEREVRRRLRQRFDVTLPRFDLMAQLDRAADGLTLSAISKRMMVSNGNVTGLVDRLVEAGHLERQASAQDRRSQIIRLTAPGRAAFRAMAVAHERWITEVFADLSADETNALMGLLAKTKGSAARAATIDAEEIR